MPNPSCPDCKAEVHPHGTPTPQPGDTYPWICFSCRRIFSVSPTGQLQHASFEYTDAGIELMKQRAGLS